MKNKVYLMPVTRGVMVQHNIICASSNGLNTTLQSEEVSSAWSREGDGDWDDED